MLTPMELKVAALLRIHMENKDIANLLYASVRTIEDTDSISARNSGSGSRIIYRCFWRDGEDMLPSVYSSSIAWISYMLRRFPISRR